MNSPFRHTLILAALACVGLLLPASAMAQTRPHWVGPGGTPPQHYTPSIPHIPQVTPHVPHHPYHPPVIPDPVPHPHYDPVIPQPTPGPTPDYVPDQQPTPIPDNAVPDNQPEPTLEPEPNVITPDIVAPQPNQLFVGHVRPVTQKDLDQWKAEALKQNQKLLDKLAKVTDGKLNDALSKIKDKLDHGQLDAHALADLAHQVSPLVHHNPAAQLEASKLLFRLNNNNRLIRLLINANININVNFNVNVNVFAGVGVIGWIPFFPFGQVIVLNNGVWFAGTGGCCGNGMWFDQGPFPQAVGMPYGAGQPVPESQLPLVTSGILLANVGNSPIRYLANQQRFSMAPGFRQVLPAGGDWTVAFDRGGSFGRALRRNPGHVRIHAHRPRLGTLPADVQGHDRQ